MTQQINLGEVIDRFAIEAPKPPRPTTIEFWWGGPEIDRTSLALRNMDDDGRIAFLLKVCEIWKASSKAETRPYSLEELHKVFGDKRDDVLGREIHFTLTANGKQFRCWHKLSGCAMRANHAESNGQGCLFSIVGEKASVKKYVDALTCDRTGCYERVIELPNGMKIWDLLWWCQYDYRDQW